MLLLAEAVLKNSSERSHYFTGGQEDTLKTCGSFTLLTNKKVSACIQGKGNNMSKKHFSFLTSLMIKVT